MLVIPQPAGCHLEGFDMENDGLLAPGQGFRRFCAHIGRFFPHPASHAEPDTWVAARKAPTRSSRNSTTLTRRCWIWSLARAWLHRELPYPARSKTNQAAGA